MSARVEDAGGTSLPRIATRPKRVGERDEAIEDETKTRSGERRVSSFSVASSRSVSFSSRCARARDYIIITILASSAFVIAPLLSSRFARSTQPPKSGASKISLIVRSRSLRRRQSPSVARTRRLEGEARVVVLAARGDARILLGDVEGAEDEDGHGEEDEAEGLIVDAEDETGAVAVEALVDNREGGERLGGEGGHGGGEGNLLGDLDLGDGRLGDDCGEETRRTR